MSRMMKRVILTCRSHQKLNISIMNSLTFCYFQGSRTNNIIDQRIMERTNKNSSIQNIEINKLDN